MATRNSGRNSGDAVYILQVGGQELYKVGYSSNVKKRVDDWCKAIPFVDLRVVDIHYTPMAKRLETSLLKRLAPFRIDNSEWFNVPPEARKLLMFSTRELLRLFELDGHTAHKSARVEPERPLRRTRAIRTVKCPQCGKPFKKTRRNRIYCSTSCRVLAWRSRTYIRRDEAD